MVNRICPRCGKGWNSADTTGTWTCETCGTKIPPLDNNKNPENEIRRV